jgi:hypothetical protein
LIEDQVGHSQERRSAFNTTLVNHCKGVVVSRRSSVGGDRGN